MNKIEIIKQEATKLTKNLFKVGLLATLTRLAQQSNQLQTISTIETVRFDFRQITEEASKH